MLVLTLAFGGKSTGFSPAAPTDRFWLIVTQVFGSRDPKHLYSTYIDPEGAYLSPTIRGRLSRTKDTWCGELALLVCGAAYTNVSREAKAKSKLRCEPLIAVRASTTAELAWEEGGLHRL